MTDETIDDIRERKRRELLAADGEASGADGPDEPVAVEGSGEFQQVVADHDVVLVDFHAEWCGPCQMLAPIVEDIAAETAATVAKVDIDSNQGLAAEYGVRGVPTLLLFVDGEQVERLVGMQQKPRLEQLIESHT